MMMLQAFQRFPNSLKEHEFLSARWYKGRLTVTYVRHETEEGEEFYSEEWVVDCPEPRVTKRNHRSANLQQILNDLERG